MPFGASRSEGSSGENINHFNSVRLRVNGSGNLLMSLKSLDDIREVTIAPIAMQVLTNIQPTRPTNMVEQRVIFRLGTTEINEWFRINRIILFAAQFGTEYPQ